jgi:4,5-dihydroxyphthalate decarboxylase
LKTVVGDYPHMQGFRTRAPAASTPCELVDVGPVGRAFDDMIEKQCYDVCELAAGAFLQGIERGKPLRVLPVVALGGFVHGRIFAAAESGIRGPADLVGRRVAIKSYSQTTAIWARGFLWEQFGVRHDAVTWVALDHAHVSDYEDPDNVEHATVRSFAELARSGGADAYVVHPNQQVPPGVVPVVEDAADAALAWYRDSGVVPANHVVSVGPSVWRSPELVSELYEMFVDSYAQSTPATGADVSSAWLDRDAVVASMRCLSRLSAEQGVLRGSVFTDDLVLTP